MIASFQHSKSLIPALLLAALLAACGGGGGGGGNGNTTPASTATPEPQLVQEAGAPAMSGNIATDGYNWINYRRGQVGLAALGRNSLIDLAAQGHSDYLKANSTVSHEQVAGKPGFTGATLADRFLKAGYILNRANSYAYGEVIAGAANNSGFYLAEELITAIYHRFAIFEPVFKEAGTGAATGNGGYAYFTADFAANNGYGPGLAAGQVVTYPVSNQTKVATSFSSNNEEPDPVPNQDVVGYPISVHANINDVLAITSFTVRQRGAASDLTALLLQRATDAQTPLSAAAIIPLAPLAANTTYDVSFNGRVNGTAVTRSWSFTTR
ncbi:CAP domain-containing protein [Janthinobacterium psychrotolerans]|uniref:Cysteine-rich secretory protein family protein n=1 Tax=Janthinobacterium psychrotolerans TaxID=1747903 RepID=A0A1A7C8M1_9BURK|nr:CAP domain-containing protein [Janthinobacterium psychrotolerans]OBV41354.1 Cysteine-rich secretory protein family protein [Janthinobacterium psychrotolerans]